MEILRSQLKDIARVSGFPRLGCCSLQVDDFIKEAYDKWLKKNYRAGITITSSETR
ncbi:MAG: hypothetical protein AABX13_00090 [Nanoarchaeota archaeon]